MRKKEKESTPKKLIVVGIGASAGGLEAFEQLLKNLSVDTGKAFVFVQHLDPGHKSSLAKIFSRYTRMPVSEARANMRLEENHVYVIPSDSYMTVANGKLQLKDRDPAQDTRYPIDLFLQSLAEDFQERAFGVILSGAGSDGTIGLKAVKSYGGITFVQDEKSAKHPYMPRSAAADASADFVLPPQRIAQELGKVREPACPPAFEMEKRRKSKQQTEAVEKILTIMRNRGGIDLFNYRGTTVERRILRRMSLVKQATMADYSEYLQNNPSEIKLLYDDIFIHVTNFFREPEKYEFLKAEVYPCVLKKKLATDPVRFWVAGCSTGEEVYSIAISLLEFLESNAPNTPMQMFASDISQTVVERARSGIYPISIEQDVSPVRLKQFFTKLDGSYQINNRIRDSCIFAKHDMTADPPFSRLDLISCCNVLIYFTPAMQSNVLKAFHYALKPSGYLSLGKSESVQMRSDLFEPLDKKNKLFVKKGTASTVLPSMYRRIPTPVQPRHEKPRKQQSDFDFPKAADQLALEKYQHRGLLIDEEDKILQFRGDVSPFLRPVSGKPSLTLSKMLREDIWLPLHTLIEAARKQHSRQKKEITIKLNGELNDINLEVIPMKHPDSVEYSFFILLDRAADSEKKQARKPGSKRRIARSKRPAGNPQRYIHSLESELEDAKQYIRSRLEEQDALNAQMNFYNEELQSSNEELQTLNEELETSTEELESSSEEVTTLNEELRNRNAELERLNDQLEKTSEYAEAIIRTVREPFLVLDAKLKVKSSNAAFLDAFHVARNETQGRYVHELGNGQWNIPSLLDMLRRILTEQPEFHHFEVEHDFEKLGHRIMSLNARRISAKDGKPDLILLAIEDITYRKELDTAMKIKIQEIHHRVKNNLQIIISLLALQAQNLKHTAGSEVFREVENRIRSIALLHEKLYLSGEEGKIVFRQYASDLAERLLGTLLADKHEVKLKIEMEDIYLDLDTALPLGLIINELITNSLNHGFKNVEGGQIRIEMKQIARDGGRQQIGLSVSDNGVGLPPEIDPQRSESMGIKIVRLLSRQIGGTISVNRQNGTSFQIEFPA